MVLRGQAVWRERPPSVPITDPFSVPNAARARAATPSASPAAGASPTCWQQGLFDPEPGLPVIGPEVRLPRLGPKGGRLGRPPGAKSGCLPDPVKLPRVLPLVVPYPVACALAGGISYGTMRNLVLRGALATVKVSGRRMIVVDGPKGLRELLTPE
jgi:hypothetical protein